MPVFRLMKDRVTLFQPETFLRFVFQLMMFICKILIIEHYTTHHLIPDCRIAFCFHCSHVINLTNCLWILSLVFDRSACSKLISSSAFIVPISYLKLRDSLLSFRNSLIAERARNASSSGAGRIHPSTPPFTLKSLQKEVRKSSSSFVKVCCFPFRLTNLFFFFSFFLCSIA